MMKWKNYILSYYLISLKKNLFGGVYSLYSEQKVEEFIGYFISKLFGELSRSLWRVGVACPGRIYICLSDSNMMWIGKGWRGGRSGRGMMAVGQARL